MLTRASRVFPAIFLAGALLLLVAGSARATTVIAQPLPQLTAQAGAIVHGTVTGVRSDWNAGRTHIFTFVSVHVDRSLKGSLGPDLTVMEFGGTVGNLRQYIPGTPQFRPGEEVVLFLSLHPPMYPSVLALSQGKFSIVADRATGTRMISRDLYGATVRGPGEALTVPPTLSAFESQVRALVAGGRPKAQRRKPRKQE
ncbi:MAG TPA: hypothetical protein VIC33_15795 [Vicinamibacterales bacterium]|jgi:hypothetical protein